ncbi:MAG: penicillin binding protein PBP4B [Lachnospiraceae bacterium]|nr:penicillin binding protein PBP4B [Lachnospiraceae bacterium]
MKKRLITLTICLCLILSGLLSSGCTSDLPKAGRVGETATDTVSPLPSPAAGDTGTAEDAGAKGDVDAAEDAEATGNAGTTGDTGTAEDAGATDPSDPYSEVVLETALPEDEGIRNECLDLIDEIITNDVAYGFPGAQLAVMRNGRLIYHNSWGYKNIDPDDPITDDTLFDLASVTKMISVNYAIQKLVTDGELDPDAKITEYLGPSFAEDVIDIRYKDGVNTDLETQKKWKKELAIIDLMMHQGGFPADPKYCNPNVDATTQEYDPDATNVLFSGNSGDETTKRQTIEAICKTPLLYEPGTKTLYSDVDYMILGLVVEKAAGTDLDTYLKENFCYPLGLKHVTYTPIKNGFKKTDCAATELNGNTRDGYVYYDGIRTYTLQGEVHDEKAWYSMGGISGHAGLFSNACDLARLGNLMLDPVLPGREGSVCFSPEVIDLFTSPSSDDRQNWGLGWWRQGNMERVKYFGSKAGPDTFGHQGWTGTLLMIDPEKQLVIAFLTNKINSPVTDKETDYNKFDGNWYTTATLGFVPEILYTGMDENGDISAELEAIVNKLQSSAEEQVTPDMSPDHPAVKNLESKRQLGN